MITCLLCGNAFDPAGNGCRPSCPMARGCSVLCCPRCGYSFPKESGFAAVLRRVLVKLERRR